MPELKLLFLQMLVVLLAARLAARAFRAVRQPGVVGEMAAGLLLGPSCLGHISPAAMNALFPASGLGPLYALSQVGLVLFMFLVGLEVRPGAIRGSARSIVFASQAGILGFCLYPTLGNGAPKLPFILFLGAAMGITAFPVLARILADRAMTKTRLGVFAISCAAVNDLTAWCLLAVITVIARPESQGASLFVRFALLAAYLVFMLFAVRPAARHLLPVNQEPDLGRFTAVIILLLASVWTTEALAVHALFGAFLAGVVMPKGGILEV